MDKSILKWNMLVSEGKTNNYPLRGLISLVCLLCAIGFVFTSHKALAATYSVTTSSACTLSDAITASDTDAISGSCAAGGSSNTINMAAGTYTLSANLPTIINHSLTVNGAGPEQTIIDGGNTYQMFNITSSGLTSVFENFTTIGAAGTNSAWYSVEDYSGGGTLNISNVVFRDSTVAGGVYVSEPGSITNSSIDNVRGPNGGALFITGFGAGEFNIINTTIEGSYGGTGVWIEDDGSGSTYNLINDTIANNASSSFPAAAGVEIWQFASPSFTVNLENTILDNNYDINSPFTADNCSSTTYANFPSELPTSLGHNISSDSTCSSVLTQTGDLNSTDPLLGSLTLSDNTYVLPITSSSPAYNAADAAAAPATDQRGITRPQCGGVDIGAYELYCAPITPSTPSSPDTGFGTPSRHSALVTAVAVTSSLLILVGLSRRFSSR